MIKILEKHVAEKIAAGEVVERPFSIVKELVENSIDAGADSIVVEIKNGGKSYIRVTDNGCGIPSNEVELAFERHATSKISTDADLDRIGTLGFRGEALACIGAVSRCELITKTKEENTGTCVLLTGLEVLDKTSVGCPKGTTIIITDLFFNTPARQKFMRTDAVESGLIIDFVSKIAIAYPDIKVRLVNNDNILFSTQGKGDVLNAILTVYSSETGKSLLAISKKGEFMALEGYISSLDMSKSNKTKQIYFVNGRHISSKVMEKGVSDAYADKLPAGKYPVCFLFLKILPEKLDVNIHPNKKEVRFDDEAHVSAFIKKAITDALSSSSALPEIKPKNIFSFSNERQRSYDEQNFDQIKDSENRQANFVKSNEQVDIKNLLSTMRQEENYSKDEAKNYSAKEESSYAKEDQAAFETQKTAEMAKMNENTQEVSATSDSNSNATAGKNKLNVTENRLNIDELSITGSIFATYITAIDDTSFYLIDQHAAHERIFYEKLVSEYNNAEKSQQLLMIPFVVNVSFAEKEGERDRLDALKQMGFEIEEFGLKAYIVKAIPMFMKLEDAQEFLDQFFDNVTENTDFTNSKIIEKLMINACKFAIKANESLAPEEIEHLLSDLSKCENPFNCPHGRPTLIKLTKSEIEKMFKRK